MTVNDQAARSLPQEQPGWRSCQSPSQFQARKGHAWASPRHHLPILNNLGSCKTEEVDEQSRHTDRHTDTHVKTDMHAHTHFIHRHQHRNMHTHTDVCMHADLGEAPRGYTNTKMHKETERNREKGQEETARRSPCIPAPELWATHPDLSPLLTSPSMAPWGN